MTKMESREKMSRTLRNMGHKPTIRGGNGKPIPVPQQAIFDALGSGWVLEYPIPTRGAVGEKLPSCYKVDIANPKAKIAIEVDGGSHCAMDRQRQDKKKDAALRSLDWFVWRVSNKSVLKNLESVTSTISRLLTERLPPTES
jgi:hypothetical protein